ncbi:SAM-dependent methyltransferase [Actinoplanes sp. NEAU-A12]|uniref:SAM-dependent methyltransferase n=1 Tax=Actinoplanes sandaracinus TaxID=3045177 RepID=A0ABT6WM59_9ACTN|nr:SAM-dependent methyltransferase [Actinoplanes sandaracinus]MDI6100817.1 SAM-dependent methyltransferase [Actinoplanes sandaracinus]
MPRRPDAIRTPNHALREARRRLPSPHRAGQPPSRTEFAELVNQALRALYPDRNLNSLAVDSRWVGKLERGEHRWPCQERRAALRQVTGARTDAGIGLYSPRLLADGPAPPVREPRRVDIAAANPARRYNYWLGGKDHFAADRESGDAIARVFPTVVTAARENRAFLRRGVRHLAESGIRQFLDVGAGLPAAENTHEVAQAVAPDCRVVYVDNDPVVMAHARALLAGDPEGRIVCLEADLHDPQAIIARSGLDLSRPVGLLLVAVLHFVHDDEVATTVVKELVSALPSGSFLVLSHGTLDFAGERAAAAFEELVRCGQADMRPRPRARVAEFLDGLRTLEPGLVPVSQWRPERPGPGAGEVANYGAVARLP